MHSDTAPRRLPRKELLIHAIHLGEMAHIRQEDADLDNTGEVRAGGLQHGAHVLDAELGHLGDAGAGRGQDLAVGLAGDLAGDVDAVGGGDGLGLFGGGGLLVGEVLFLGIQKGDWR
jgi:hypothetical protein